MSFLSLILIAIALSVDAMAVSAANGAQHHNLTYKAAIKISLCFGLFHFTMPLIGWLLGSNLQKIISTYDHWIAFGLLLAIGLKMIIESLKPVTEKDVDINSFKILFLLSVALSIDALVIGMSLALLPVNIWYAASIIGLSNFILSFVSVYLGKACGNFLGKIADIGGGLILIIIGFNIIISHLFK